MKYAFVIDSIDNRGMIMAISFDNALGIHPQALALREKRSEVLASNLANADTPNYKARDLDFQSILKQQMPSSNSLERTESGHIHSSTMQLGAELMYRNPHQASLDGNTVETHIEQSKFAENSVQYQASLTFLNNKFSGLMTAIRGD